MQIIDSHYVKLKTYLKLLIALCMVLISPALFAHGVAEGDKGYIQEIYGVHVIPFIYLGAITFISSWIFIGLDNRDGRNLTQKAPKS